MAHRARKRNVIAIAAALVAGHLLAAQGFADPDLPTGIPNDAAHTFNIASFGASTANTGTANFTAINNAIGSLNAAGGGVLIVPAGTFVVNPGLTIKTHTNLQINGTLQAPPISSYGNAGTNFLNTTSNSTDILISGSGTIDGNATFSTGAGDTEWWGSPTLGISAASSRPRLLRVNSCIRFELTGVHLMNSPMFHVSFNGTVSQYTIDNISINAPSNAPNTDAIDLTGNNGLVKFCNISVGDDNIVLKPQSVAMSAIAISSCTFGSGHGVSIGGQTAAGVNGFTVGNCTFNGTGNGIHLKAGRTDAFGENGGLVQNATFTNLTMTGVASPFDISGYYINGGDQTNPLSPTHIPKSPAPQIPGAPVLADASMAFAAGVTPQWNNLTFSNITINGTASNNNFFYGVPEGLLQNLVLSNINYQTQPNNGLNFINVADVHLTSSMTAPIQCAVATSMELSGAAGTPVTLTQTFSSSLNATAQALKTNVDGGTTTLTNYNSSFNPSSVNTVRITGDFNLGQTAGTAGVYNLNGGSLVVGGTMYVGNAGTGSLTVNGGTGNVGTMILGNSGAGVGTLTLTSGNLSAGTTAIKNGSRINYNGGQLATGSLTLSSGGRLNMSAGGNKTLLATGLSIDPTSQLDLSDNGMVIDYTGSIGSIANDLRDSIQAGRFISSSHPANTVIGYVDNSVALLPMFGGVSLDLTAILIKNTFAGDSNLDGKVDVTDLTALASHWQQQSGGLWYGGDFNYDGVVDIRDLALLGQNWQVGVGSPLAPSLQTALASLSLPTTAIPEPVAAILLSLPIFMVRRRRTIGARV